jgi:hypothetical protein
MWLINTRTFRLEDFVGSSIPQYAVLSHTWGSEEISFRQMQSNFVRFEKGFAKIERTCRLALDDHIDYVWIDTCCIDKTSSAELSEAINSMFEWYRNSVVCYAFLCDLDPSTETELGLPHCRWFTRGWTLQELIAPSEVRFYDSAWHFRGTKGDLLERISDITHIDAFYLQNATSLLARMRRTHAAVKMSWISYRSTTRVEDMAYCLLGLFNINMPLLYGEGSKAFRRLQEEILKKDGDLSLLAWKPGDREVESPGILAQCASEFAWICGMEINFSVFVNRKECDITSRGLRYKTRLLKHPLPEFDGAPSPPYFRLVLDLDCWADIPDAQMGKEWRSPAPGVKTISFGVCVRKYGKSSYCRDVTNLGNCLVILNPFQPLLKCPAETALVYVDRESIPECFWTGFPVDISGNVNHKFLRQVGVHFPKQPDLDIIHIADRDFWDASNRMLLCGYHRGLATVITVRPNKAVYDMSDIILLVKPLHIFSGAKIVALDSRSKQAQYLLENISKVDDEEFINSPELGVNFSLNQVVRTDNQKWDITCSVSREIVAEISRLWKVSCVELRLSPVSIESNINAKIPNVS